MYKSLMTVLTLVVLPLSILAETENNLLTAQPVSVSTFKNGVALVVAQVELPEEGQSFQVKPLPDAVLGGFWISWPEGMQLSNIRATQVQNDEQVSASNLAELLEANIEQKVDLLIDDAWHRVTIIEIPEKHDGPIILPREENIIPPPPPFPRGNIVIVESEREGVKAIPIDQIKQIRFSEGDYKIKIARPGVQNVIAFDVKERSNESKVQITYLAKGISWSPSYIVDISNEKQAQISAKAVVVNDLIPMKSTFVELIAGYPHIEFSDVGSAFSLKPLQQILEGIRGLERERGRRQEMMLSNVMAQRVAFDSAPMASMPDVPVSGQMEEDLYFYELKDVTLKQGERGYFPLFGGEVPFEHIYTWDIPDYINENNMRYQPEPQSKEIPEVWHSLKLTNSTDQPWTTAPAMTIKNGHILGQDTLKYTPSRASSDLKITRAVAVKAEQNEYEVERQRNAAQFYHTPYDLVTVRGELKLTNFKEDVINVEISKTVSGEVIDAEGEPEISKLAEGLRSVNAKSKILWKKEVKPGQDNAINLVYQYQVYVRN